VQRFQHQFDKAAFSNRWWQLTRTKCIQAIAVVNNLSWDPLSLTEHIMHDTEDACRHKQGDELLRIVSNLNCYCQHFGRRRSQQRSALTHQFSGQPRLPGPQQPTAHTNLAQLLCLFNLSPASIPLQEEPHLPLQFELLFNISTSTRVRDTDQFSSTFRIQIHIHQLPVSSQLPCLLVCCISPWSARTDTLLPPAMACACRSRPGPIL
jgi:hypothetical protein